MKNVFLAITFVIPLVCFSQTYIHGSGKTAIKMTSTSASYYYNKNRNDCNCDNSSFYENYPTYKNKPKYDFKNPKHSRKCICWTRNPKQGGPQSYALNTTYPKGKWINEHFIDSRYEKQIDYVQTDALGVPIGFNPNEEEDKEYDAKQKADSIEKVENSRINERMMSAIDSVNQEKINAKKLRQKEQEKQDSIVQVRFQERLEKETIEIKKRNKNYKQ